MIKKSGKLADCTARISAYPMGDKHQGVNYNEIWYLTYQR